MAIATSRAPSRRGERLFSAADLAELPAELPSGPVLYELENGRLIAMSPTRDEHGAVEVKIASALYDAERRGLGKSRCGEVGIVLWRNPDRVVGADAVFIANRSLPIRRSPEGYLETIPDLVVEIASRNDTKPYLRRKVEDYRRAGVRLVWLVEPKPQTITVYRAGADPVVLREGDVLTAEEIIPGFQLAVAAALEE